MSLNKDVVSHRPNVHFQYESLIDYGHVPAELHVNFDAECKFVRRGSCIALRIAVQWIDESHSMYSHML